MVKDHGNPLAGHSRYRKIQDLSEGAFGFVQVCIIVTARLLPLLNVSGPLGFALTLFATGAAGFGHKNGQACKLLAVMWISISLQTTSYLSDCCVAVDRKRSGSCSTC